MIEHHIGVSRRAGLVHTVSRTFFKPTMRWYPLRGPATRLMPLLDRSCALIPRLSTIEHVEVTGPDWRGELVTPVGGPTVDGAVLYLHGGAFLLCGMATHRRIVERLAEATGLSVLSVDYRQLPVGRLHDSIADALEAFDWLVAQGHPPSRIVLAGDSAGGHLAFATALRLRATGRGGPAALIAMSPWLDFDHRPKLRHLNARRDAYIPVRRMEKVGRMVVGERPELHHSPVNADLRGLPPTLILCAEGEVLRVDAELMTSRLAEAGVPCALQIWEGQVHAFPVLADLTPESTAAIAEVAEFATAAVTGGLGLPATGRAARRAGVGRLGGGARRTTSTGAVISVA